MRAAAAAGDEPSNALEVYRPYLKPLPPIDIMPTTGPGLIQHINDIGDNPLTAGFLYSGEFSDELAYNQDMLENIKILSEIYDTGDKEAKYTKGAEHRSKAVNGQPVSALFVGSPGHILYDEATKKKFHVAFMSKLARRSWFCYAPEKIPEPDFSNEADPIQAFWDYEDNLEVTAKQARKSMEEHIKAVTAFGLSSYGQDLTLPDEVTKLFKLYKRYNTDVADALPNQESTSALIRRHLQWKAIKLAGAFAILDQSNSIQPHHYIEAIQFCELLTEDMALFEFDLGKADHERFADYIRTQVLIDNKALMSIHDLKKQNFVSSTTRAKLQELVSLCCAYDTTGIYSIVNEGSAIQYEPIVKTDRLHVTYKQVDLTAVRNAVSAGNYELAKDAKQQVAMTAAYGFESGETTFEDLGHLLSRDFAFTPFRFKNGVRSKDNVYGGTKWLVFDIDHSPLSASEVHFMLSDINHHIALGSDPSNEYKFHLLIELDSVVDLDSITWKYFYTSVATHLAIQIDILPQSQIFYSYAGHPVLSVVDAEPLPIRQFVLEAKEKRTSVNDKPLSTVQQRALLEDPTTTFKYCYEADFGTGSRSMIRMIYHMRDLGASKAEIIKELEDVQAYWSVPMDRTRFENTILSQVDRICK